MLRDKVVKKVKASIKYVWHFLVRQLENLPSLLGVLFFKLSITAVISSSLVGVKNTK